VIFLEFTVCIVSISELLAPGAEAPHAMIVFLPKQIGIYVDFEAYSLGESFYFSQSGMKVKFFHVLS
jgi:hypothetical protein